LLGLLLFLTSEPIKEAILMEFGTRAMLLDVDPIHYFSNHRLKYNNNNNNNNNNGNNNFSGI
jgi:hypothetical protein